MGKWGKPIGERFLEKVDRSGDCWLWIAATNGKQGYGVMWDGSKQVLAHRWSYENHVGPIPPGLDLDHLCRVRLCVNPAHLEPVTRSVNLRRGQTIVADQVARAACPHGHAYTEENTKRSRDGSRECRTCDLARQRQWWAANRSPEALGQARQRAQRRVR